MREIIYNLKITNLVIYHGKSEMLRKNCRSLRIIVIKRKKDKKMIAGRLKKANVRNVDQRLRYSKLSHLSI